MKRNALAVILALLAATALPAAAEDVSYLKAELRETKARHLPVAVDLGRADAFLTSYDQRRDDLAAAARELRELKTQLRSTLHKNLVKSTIMLSLETYGKINLVIGFAKQSVLQIATAVAAEAASNEMQGSFSSPYGQSVKGLSDETRKLLPELEDVQKVLRMTMDEVKAEARTGGDELGDTGAIYRKFQMILDRIEKAEDKLIAVNRSLEETKGVLETLVDKLKPEAERLGGRIKDLTIRLGSALEQERAEEIERAVEEARQSVKQPSAPPMPAASDNPTVEEYMKVYKTAETVIRPRWPLLCAEIDRRRKEYAEDYRSFLEQLRGQELIALVQGRPAPDIRCSNEPEPVTPSLMPSLPALAELHAGSKKAVTFYTGAIPNVREARAALNGFRSRLIETAGLEKELEALGGLADEVEAVRARAMGYQSVLQGYMPYQLLRELTPRGFERSIRSIDEIAGLAALDEFLEGYERDFPGFIEIYDRNIKACEKVFPGTVKEYERRFAKLMEDLVNLDNAHAQMLGCAAGYEKAVRESKWRATRNPSFAEHYYAAERGGIKANLEAVFNPAAFHGELLQALGEESLSPAETLMRRYRDLADRCGDLDAKYTSAWNHYYYYLSEAKNGLGGTYIGELENAAKVEGAELKVRPPDTATMRKLRDRTFPFERVWSPLTGLPEVSVTGRQAKALEAYELRKMLLTEGKQWHTLDRDGFLKKFNDATARINEFQKDTLFAPAAAMMKQDAGMVYDAYRTARPEFHGDGIDIPWEPEPGQPAPHVELSDVRLNGLIVYGAQAGEIVLLRNDLRNGAIEITARLSAAGRIARVLASEDGGTAWKELPAGEAVTWRLTPLPDKAYSPLLRVTTGDGQQFDFPLFPGAQGIVYRDIDYRTLAAQTMKAIAEAYERQDIGLFSRHVSGYFTAGRQALEEGVRLDFDLFSAIRIAIYIDRIDRRGDAVAVETHWEKTQSVRSTGAGQKSTGRTAFTLGLEEGLMKIRALRGNLLYATLSPEIGQASGLPAAVVDQLETARDTRTPVQPGAGTVNDPSAASLTLLSPNGGESWSPGGTQTIAWAAGGAITDVKLEYSTDSGATYPNLIAARTPATAGSFTWTVPAQTGAAHRVKVSDADNPAVFDTSNANFSVTSGLETGTFTLSQYSAHPMGAGAVFLQGFRFDTRGIVDETDLNFTSDITRREGYIEARDGTGIIDLGAVSLDSITEAPASGYAIAGTDLMPTPVQGHCYAIKTVNNKYAAVEITSLDDHSAAPAPWRSTFRYKYQKTGSRGFAE